MTAGFNKFLKTLVLEYSDDNTFTASVDVDVYVEENPLLAKNPDLVFDTSAKTKVTYAIDIEYKSWGINSIDARIIKIEDFTIEYVDYSKGDEQEEYKLATIKISEIEPRDVKQEFAISKHGTIYPTRLTITLDSSLTPLASKCVVVF
jgi:hypothetical protein